jgi:AcrR family transcriptional regulator
MAMNHPYPGNKAVPRQPFQQRAKDRFEHVIEEAQVLLLEQGIAGFSIPALAERLGYVRGTIYNLFPTPNALLNELVQRYLGELETALVAEGGRLIDRPWQETLRGISVIAANFYNSRPVARMLLLGAPVSDESYRAFELTIQHLGGLANQLLVQRGLELPPAPPDIAMLAVELGTTCFRVSVLMHGEITAAYQEEARRVMVAYLSEFLGPK